METKVKERLIQRVLSSLRPEIHVTVRKLEGTNLEVFSYEGHDVEVSIYTDRVCASIYLAGQLKMRSCTFRDSDGDHQEVDAHPYMWPNYRVRNQVRTYVNQRLANLKAQQEESE